MFYVLELSDYTGKNPLIKKLRQLFPFHQKPYRVEIPLCTYMVLPVYTVNGSISLKKLRRATAPYAHRLVLPTAAKALDLPHFNADFFLDAVLFNTAAYLLSRAADAQRKLSAAVIDHNGCYISGARQLLRHASEVRIFTDYPELYRLASDQTIDQFGADFILCEKSYNPAQIDLIVSPGETPKCIYTQHGRYTLENETVKIGAGFRHTVPPGVSECDFGAALVKFEGHKRFMLVKSEHLRLNDRIVDVARSISLQPIAETNLPATGAEQPASPAVAKSQPDSVQEPKQSTAQP